MKKLLVYPTSRALREISALLAQSDSLLPTLMRMDEFEQRAILLDDRAMIDPIRRVILLKKAASFEKFKEFKFDLNLVKFFSKSDAIFKFFEELSHEMVTFSDLTGSDSYAEFDQHLAILEQLQDNYRTLLEQEGYTDRAFITKEYHINMGFLSSFENIEIYLEGYLSLYELRLVEQISNKCQVIIHYDTSKFNIKMQERFSEIGIKLPTNSSVSFDIAEKKILNSSPNNKTIQPAIYSVDERLEQVSQALVSIEQMVQEGISADSIALILPDEKLKEYFMLFDKHNNLNFAMGYDYDKKRAFRLLDALYRYWQNPNSDNADRAHRFGIDIDKIIQDTHSKKVPAENLFELLRVHQLLDVSTPILEKMATAFLRSTNEIELTMKEWLFLWLKELSTHTIDDVRGGKITVMGLLETRGISFDGVVIVDFNDGIVPTSPSKDQFLNSSVRASAGLPTRSDRSSLQKQYYKKLLENAKKSVIIYSTAENRIPSKFLYELGLDDAIEAEPPLKLFYDIPSKISKQRDPIVEDFDATKHTWSASRLKVYLECKRKFYYRYIEKIKPVQDDEINEGTLLHKLLEGIFENRDSFTVQSDMKKAISEQLSALLPDDDSKSNFQRSLLYKKLEALVQSQIKHFDAGWKIVAKEREYSSSIAGLQFRGIIDRVDQRDGHTLVIDYKSGSIQEANRSKSLEKLSEFQMSIYKHITDGKFQNRDFVFLMILDGGKLQEIKLLEEKNILLVEHIQKLKETKKFTASKCDDISKCRYCEFTLLCGRGEYL